MKAFTAGIALGFILAASFWPLMFILGGNGS